MDQYLSFAKEVAQKAGEIMLSYFDNDVKQAAALKIIVEEAGGKVTDLAGQDQRYDRDIRGVVISNGVVHEEIVRYTKDLLI